MPESQPVTLSEAARVLQVSRRAVQRMLREGTLQGEKHGAGWAITLPVDGQAGPAEEGTDDHRAQVEQLAEERAALAERVRALETRVDELVQEREGLAQQARDLAAQADQWAKERAEMVQRARDLRAQLSAAQAKMTELRMQHDRALASMATARAVAEARLADVTAERDRLLAQTEEAHRQVAALTGALFQMTQKALPAPSNPRPRSKWRFWQRDEPQSDT